jgi:hypothetical protein
MENKIAVSSPPPYFSWVQDKLLAVSAFPYHHSHLRYLIDNRIHVVVSLAPEKEPPFHSKPDLKIIKFDIADSDVPSLDHCRYFVNLIDSSKMRKEVMITGKYLISLFF